MIWCYDAQRYSHKPLGDLEKNAKVDDTFMQRCILFEAGNFSPHL